MSSFNHRFIFYTPDVLMQIIISFAYVCALFSVETLFISLVALCDCSLSVILVPTVPRPLALDLALLVFLAGTKCVLHRSPGVDLSCLGCLHGTAVMFLYRLCTLCE